MSSQITKKTALDKRTGTKKVPAIHHHQPLSLQNDTVQGLPARSTMMWPRKIFHMCGIGSVGLVMATVSFTTLQALFLLSVFTLIIAGFDYGRRFVPALNEKITKDWSAIMRDYERKSLSGMSWFMFATLIIVAMVPLKLAALACLILAFGDPWASVIGIKFGKRKIFGGRKTLEGVLGGMAVCTLVSAVFFAATGLVAPAMIVPAALLAGLTGALAESMPFERIDDNFTIPVVTAPALAGIVALLG